LQAELNGVTTLRGPVEVIAGRLTLCVPLSTGGDRLVACTVGIATVEGDALHIEIRGWLAEKLGIVEGCEVVVDNAGGEFNIRRASNDS